MKKLITMLVVLFILYLGIQFLFTFFGKGESVNYEIEKNGTVLNIEEISNFRLTDNKDNYQYKIKGKNHTFNFQVFNDFSKITHTIIDIAHYQDDKYECILPIYKENITLSDIMCYDGNVLTYYYNLKGKSQNLDNFANGIKEYKASSFVDTDVPTDVEGIKVYKNNLIKDHYIEITSYAGLYNISSNFNSLVYKISLYNKDIYNQKISAFTGEYYISADYNQQYEFNKINIVDFVHLNTSTIASNKAISIDSYIQGVVDGKVYLYDKDNKKQYEINPSKQTVVELNSNEIKYYNNGTWSTMSIADANAELKFKNSVNDYENKEYDRIDKVGNEQGYYYLYKKVNDNYEVYRMDFNNKDSLIYLFTTKAMTNIYYVNNYVYFINGDTIRLYNNNLGTRNLISYNELEFNKNINFYICAK